MNKCQNLKFKYFEKLRFSKKGQVDQSIGLMEMMEYIPKVVVLIIVMFIIYNLVNIGVKNEVDVFEAESDMVMQRLLYSQNGLSYYDTDLRRLYPGTIVLENFNDKRLESMFSQEEDKTPHFAMKLKLQDVEFADKFEDLPEIEIAYFNSEWYHRWEVLTGYLGSGGKRLLTETFQVTILHEDGKRTMGDLEINIIFPND